MSANKKQILLLCGGGGEEHDVSLKSAKYIHNALSQNSELKIHLIELHKDGRRIDLVSHKEVELRRSGELYNCTKKSTTKLDFAIPCFHGYPGESGDIQSLFEMMNLPYLGTGPEGSMLCLNKISTKLWLEAMGLPTTPFIFITKQNDENLRKLKLFFHKYDTIYIKAATQGSSIGCYRITDEKELEKAYEDVFNFSNSAVCEKEIIGRELEVSVFEYDGEIIATHPGEIICDSKFYSYKEKYNDNGATQTEVEAKNISKEQEKTIKEIAINAFDFLNLRHLSRIDFFLSDSGEILINEINTFPGMTPISLFPKMMENSGLKFSEYLQSIISKELRK